MQNWFFVQSAKYGNYYIEVDVNDYGVYNIWIGMLHSDGSVGHQANTLTTSNKSSARRKYNKFTQDAEADSYGWNYKVPDLSWKFDINTELNSVQEYILSNPKNIKASSYIRTGSNMKKQVRCAKLDDTLNDAVYNELQNKVDEIFLHFQKELGIISGDIYPEDSYDLDNMIEELSGLITKVLSYEN